MINTNLEKESEKIKITQILPDVFTPTLALKEALCLTVEKKKTGVVMESLKESGLITDKVYLKNVDDCDNFNSKPYMLGRYKKSYFCQQDISKLDSHYSIYDISFLKRAKPLNENENIIFVGFTEVLFDI